ncbi:MAG: CPBP family intramembrane metalloprotease [Propionibacteriaceae bacterium]|nr:CPBP family intramembrane metalloprotease [Propionibacteriaceae bacterium]
MTNLVPQLISAVLQIAVLLLIPFIWWLVRARKQQGFFRWLGWQRPRIARPGPLVLIMGATLAVFAALGVAFIPAVGQTSRSPLTGLGFAGLGAGLIYAVAQTAFAEECLFRGFIGRRVAARCGFQVGNLVQAICFGLAHMVPFLLLGMNPLISAGTGLYSGAIGWIMGWLNERMAGGSLLPSWILHALANLLSVSLTLFVLG